ncbi:MAG TPA: transcription elongation factor GreA [Dehalococcoidia bacterium]
MANDTTSISSAARQFADSLPPAKHRDSREALRFAEWFGDEKVATDIRPANLEEYVEKKIGSAADATERADSLKNFLAYMHKQKILPERLVSHVRVRRQGSRPRASSTAVPEQPQEVRMTSAGKAALEAELEELQEQRPKIALELREARSDGDFRENAPLDAAREAQGQLEARIRELENMLRHAVLVETDDQAGAGARIGSRITIINVATNAKSEYQLVNAAEARPGTGRLSVESPVGAAVLGKRVGDEVLVTAPSGVIRFRVDGIESGN